MGTWATGPFDADQALDFLDELWDRSDAGRQAAVVVEGLRSRLTAAPSCDDDGVERAETYAAAGLVAAVLDGRGAEPSSGTRLMGTILAGGSDDGDPLGLGAHCGTAAMLSEPDARGLAPAAAAAVARLKVDGAWHDCWRPDCVATLKANLDRLVMLLKVPGGPTA